MSSSWYVCAGICLLSRGKLRGGHVSLRCDVDATRFRPRQLSSWLHGGRQRGEQTWDRQRTQALCHVTISGHGVNEPAFALPGRTDSQPHGVNLHSCMQLYFAVIFRPLNHERNACMRFASEQQNPRRLQHQYYIKTCGALLFSVAGPCRRKKAMRTCG